MIRRKKKSKAENGSSLLSLPKMNVQIHLVKLGNKARKLHQLYMNKAEEKLEYFEKIEGEEIFLTKIEKKFNNKRKRRIFLGILGVISKLRQICCH